MIDAIFCALHHFTFGFLTGFYVYNIQVNWANTSIELSRQNMNRFVRILFPPKPEVLSNMCQQGFDDALQFLHRNNLISCTRCLAVQSTFVVHEAVADSTEEYDPDCIECQRHRMVSIAYIFFINENFAFCISRSLFSGCTDW